MGVSIWLSIEVDTGNEPYSVELFSNNITHNVAPMWNKAGVYDAIYNSEGKAAGELIITLRAGVYDMTYKRPEYELLNPKNGWGDYVSALSFLTSFASACELYPNAIVGVSK
jgi:hypothetical protein